MDDTVIAETLVTNDAAVVDDRSLTDEVVHRLRTGDTEAMALSYRQHHEAIRAFGRRLLGNRSLAEDLVQDVFVMLPSALRGFRNDCTLRTFLLSLAVNKSKHYVRTASRCRRRAERVAAEPPSLGPSAPDEWCERRELASELLRALDTLPLDERIAVVFCDVEERTASEVAAIVHAPEATVRTRLWRGRKRLRAILGGAS